MTAGEAIARVRTVDLEARWVTPALLVGLTALSLVLRTRILGAGYWIDEGISVGIAHHPFADIPGLLRQDGSPPLYYLLLNLWIAVAGDSERATHTLSLLFALACVPVAFWAADALFGRVSGWVCAGLAALDPYLTAYGQETRMYAVLALLSLAVSLAYVRAILEGRRRWLPALVAGLTLMLYTHNWALFFCLGLAVATLLVARDRLRESLIVAGATLLLYAPWLPTLLDQVRHTGAPWSTRPTFHDLLLAPGSVFWGDAPLTAIGLAGGAGLVTLWRSRSREEHGVVLALAVTVAVTVVVAWLFSQLSPAWATRYFAIVFGPLLLLGSAGIARAGRLGVIALVLVLVLWTNASPRPDKSSVREVAALAAPYVHPGDLVISTHPEQTPALRYYLGNGFRWATPLGTVRDPRIMNWRDAVDRLQAATPRTGLEPQLAEVRPGQRVILVQPIFRDYRAWKAEWTKLVYLRSVEWSAALQRDPRFRHLKHLAANEILLQKRFSKPVQADVYVRSR